MGKQTAHDHCPTEPAGLGRRADDRTGHRTGDHTGRRPGHRTDQGR